MPLETGTYISDLVSTNPAQTDSVGQADNHLRFIKSTLLATFTAITGAVTATHTQLNSAVAAVVTGLGQAVCSVGTVGAPGVSFLGSLTSGLYSPATNQVAISTNGTQAVLVKDDQSVTVAGAYAGGTGQLIPVGLPLPWLSDTLPSAYFGWLNGQAISRTIYPVLYAMWGTKYGAGDGSTTFNVPNWQEVVPIGKAGMGGASNPGLVTNSGINTTGTIIGEGKHTLSSAEMPVHSHGVNDPGHNHGVNDPGHLHTVNYGSSPGGSLCQIGSNFAGTENTSTAVTGISIAAAATGISLQNAGSGTAHNIVQPSVVTNWIVLLG